MRGTQTSFLGGPAHYQGVLLSRKQLYAEHESLVSAGCIPLKLLVHPTDEERATEMLNSMGLTALPVSAREWIRWGGGILQYGKGEA